ncbi:copper chaperone PCu(A)C [Streptomyces sp. NPDC048172]|uniref:copper chaperone PCu(A)C n=1 Tax=Streptomyces sp. NPDC048172 TaxID=3365505 RepID=UPI003711E2B8
MRPASRARRSAVVLPVAASVVTALALSLVACSSDGEGGKDGEKKAAATKSVPRLKIEGAYVPQPVDDKMAGGFLTVRNSGGTADKLTSVTSDLSGDVTMHKTVKQQMSAVKSFTVPADGSLKLERGGNHLMLMELKRKPKKGDEVTFTLHFAKSGAVTVKAPVEATNHTPDK